MNSKYVTSWHTFKSSILTQTCHRELEARTGTIKTNKKITTPLESNYEVDSSF